MALLIIAGCCLSEVTLACTAYSRKLINLGDYADTLKANAALSKVRSEFYHCSCGGSYTDGKFTQIVNDCQFQADYGKYNYSKYVALQISSYKSDCPASSYKSPTGKCESFTDPTKYGAGESGGICGGNPIDFSNGVKIQHETDYSFASNSILKYTRIYSSMDGA